MLFLERGLARVAPETVETVEWKIPSACDMLKYEAFILRCDRAKARAAYGYAPS